MRKVLPLFYQMTGDDRYELAGDPTPARCRCERTHSCSVSQGGRWVCQEFACTFARISESGSYVRFFIEMIAMYLIAAAMAFYLITAAYV